MGTSHGKILEAEFLHRFMKKKNNKEKIKQE
jgi:hypothetical protein